MNARHISLSLVLALMACEGVVRPTRPSDAHPDDFFFPDTGGDLDRPDGATNNTNTTNNTNSTNNTNTTSPCNDQEAYLDGYCYRALGVGQMTYQMARDTCESGGYQPISIHSAAENQLVFDLLYMWTSCSWLGMTRSSGGGNFAWEDGTPVDYENWEPNEPDADTCACIGGPAAATQNQGQWQDVRCSQQFREIVCKRKP